MATAGCEKGKIKSSGFGDQKSSIVRYDTVTIRYICVRLKADEMASLV